MSGQNGTDPNPLGQITAFLGGTDRMLRLTLGETMALEQRIGRSSFKLLTGGDISVTEAVAVIYHALRGAGGELSMDAVANMLDKEPRMLDVTGLAMQVLAAKFLGAKNVPPRPQLPTAETKPN